MHDDDDDVFGQSSQMRLDSCVLVYICHLAVVTIRRILMMIVHKNLSDGQFLIVCPILITDSCGK